jgi:hypothetical protein
MPGVHETPLAAEPVINRVGEDDWRVWRDVRLAALADAPEAFASGTEQEEVLPEDDWRAMTRTWGRSCSPARFGLFARSGALATNSPAPAGPNMAVGPAGQSRHGPALAG